MYMAPLLLASLSPTAIKAATATVSVPAQHRRLQSSEPSPWDSTVYPRLSACAAKNDTFAITQQSATSVQMTYSGFTAQMVWLTDEAGTIIAFFNSTPASPVTLSWVEHLTRGSEPLTLLPHAMRAIAANSAGQTCEEVTPTSRETSPTWRKLYLDATTNCCKEDMHSASQITSYKPLITLNNWIAQTFDIAATQCAPVLNYAFAEPGGELLQVEPAAACGAGSYQKVGIPFPHLAQSLVACAALDVNGEINPICERHGLLDETVSSLEQPNNMQMPSTNVDVAVTYAGTLLAPKVAFAATASCPGSTFYTRLGSSATSTPVGAFANATSLTVSVPTTGSIYLYRCCAHISVVSSRSPPVQCSTPLRRYTFDATELRALADANLQAALNTPNAYGSLNSVDYGACHIPGGIGVGGSTYTYPEGSWFINATNGENCTCAQAKFACVSPEGVTKAIWTSGQVAAVATLATIGGLVVIGGVIVGLWRQQRSMKLTAIPRMGALPRSTGDAQPTFERSQL